MAAGPSLWPSSATRNGPHLPLASPRATKANLSAGELRTYKQAAKIVLALTQAQIDTEVREGRLFEVNDDAQDL